MRLNSSHGVNRTPWRNLVGKADGGCDDGFTLIELIIVALVLPIIVGALTLALISVFSFQNSVSGRLSGSGDAQVVSSNFESDVQGASEIFAPLSGVAVQSPRPAACGSGTVVLSLQTGLQKSDGTYPTEISYVLAPVSGSSTYDTLLRNVCQLPSTTPTSSSTISNDVSPTQTAAITCSSALTSAEALTAGQNALSVSSLPAAVTATDSVTLGSGSNPPTVAAQTGSNPTALSLVVNTSSAISSLPVGTPVVDTAWAASNCGAAANWIFTDQVNITGVTFAVTEPSTATGVSPYSYTLAASPRSSGPPSPQTTVASPTGTSCGFASPGTGTYASSLCFVDFSAYVPGGSSCQEMTATIESTYVLSFCLSVTGAAVQAAAFPTYAQAFLGNNNFYTGVPNKPALYQTQSGTTTVTMTGIQLTDSSGATATGWNLVTGDAETTDSSESITWLSDTAFTLIPNNQGVGPVGDACSNPTPPDGLTPAIILTGGSSTLVECQSSVSTAQLPAPYPPYRDGTVMLEAPTPTTLTDTLVGSGLEGIFIGFLLPS
jgi:hypothetical protein